MSTHDNVESHVTMITHSNAKLHGTTYIETLNPLDLVKFNFVGPTKLGPKLISKIMSPTITQFQIKSSPNTLNELENIRVASKFLESYNTLEACFVDPGNIEKSIEVTLEGTLTLQLKIIPYSGEKNEINNHSKEIVEGTTMHAPIPNECNLQLLFVHDVE